MWVEIGLQPFRSSAVLLNRAQNFDAEFRNTSSWFWNLAHLVGLVKLEVVQHAVRNFSEEARAGRIVDGDQQEPEAGQISLNDFPEIGQAVAQHGVDRVHEKLRDGGGVHTAEAVQGSGDGTAEMPRWVWRATRLRRHVGKILKLKLKNKKEMIVLKRISGWILRPPTALESHS